MSRYIALCRQASSELAEVLPDDFSYEEVHAWGTAIVDYLDRNEPDPEPDERGDRDCDVGWPVPESVWASFLDVVELVRDYRERRSLGPWQDEDRVLQLAMSRLALDALRGQLLDNGNEPEVDLDRATWLADQAAGLEPLGDPPNKRAVQLRVRTWEAADREGLLWVLKPNPDNAWVRSHVPGIDPVDDDWSAREPEITGEDIPTEQGAVIELADGRRFFVPRDDDDSHYDDVDGLIEDSAHPDEAGQRDARLTLMPSGQTHLVVGHYAHTVIEDRNSEVEAAASDLEEAHQALEEARAALEEARTGIPVRLESKVIR